MSNPIHQILPDDLYQVLVRLKLLNQKTIRDFQIKRRYQQLRDEGKRPQEALEVILEEYPYLQFDTIRKIVYSVKLPEELRMIVA
ncbi:MAG: hypothetical protein EAZ89_00905 [Bacteroidetes bacterium]|nr:MAG: hypothetical protein EAZ89_00905 [Bacteroidota bacterium]